VDMTAKRVIKANLHKAFVSSEHVRIVPHVSDVTSYPGYWHLSRHLCAS